MRALAVTAAKRSPQLPEVPTISEAGIHGVEAVTFTGLFAPAGTPAPVVATLNAALRKTMANREVRSRFEAIGVDLMDMTQEEFARYVRAEYDKWVRVAREAGISVE
jgi:tripartite-type tricarboxylate transporter receptor subunit TctC